MLSGKSIDCMVYKKKDAVLNVLEPRRFKSGAPFDGAVGAYVDYLALGYTAYDIPLNGGLSWLSGKAAGNYLCYWRSCTPAYLATPLTGTATAGGASTITLADASTVTKGMIIKLTAGTGSGQYNVVNTVVGNVVTVYKAWTTAPDNTTQFSIGEEDLLDYTDISPHTKVIIFGGKINSTNSQIDGFVDMRVGFSGDIDASKCTFANCMLKAESSVGSQMPTIENCDIELTGNSYAGYGITPTAYTTISNSIINLNTYTFWVKKIDLSNCYIYNGSYSDSASSTTYVSNVYFYDVFVTYGVSSFNNVFIDECVIGTATASGAIYYKNSNISVRGALILPALETQKFIFGVPEIDFTSTVDFADFVSLDVDISRTDQADSRLFGFGQENFYVMKFLANASVPDALKKGIGEGYYWFIRRKDFETDLDGKTIYNLGLYTAGGHTTAYDFASDENFLILAEDSSGNKAVLVWYSNQLYPTVYSDVWDGTDYEILNCFQIWEAESRTGIQNIFKDQTTSKGITNSPMGGQIRFNNLDREILIRI